MSRIQHGTICYHGPAAKALARVFWEEIEAMDIFVGNLPLSVTVVELRRLFGKAGATARYRIVQKQYADGTTRCYGRAMIEPDESARILIGSLDRALLHGRPLEVRRFVQRNLANERRAPMWRGRPWHGLDRRKGERRNGAR